MFKNIGTFFNRDIVQDRKAYFMASYSIPSLAELFRHSSRSHPTPSQS